MFIQVWVKPYEAVIFCKYNRISLSGFIKLLKFGIMQLQVDIGFDQLVKLVKKLPAAQWRKLKTEVEEQPEAVSTSSDLEAFLLNAPTFNKKQLDEIAKTRKAISQ